MYVHLLGKRRLYIGTISIIFIPYTFDICANQKFLYIKPSRTHNGLTMNIEVICRIFDKTNLKSNVKTPFWLNTLFEKYVIYPNRYCISAFAVFRNKPIKCNHRLYYVISFEMLYACLFYKLCKFFFPYRILPFSHKFIGL